MPTEIEKLLDLTEQMYCLAITGEWDEVAKREADRITIIKSSPFLGDTTDSVLATKLNEIIEKNAEIVALAVVEKNNIANEIRFSRKIEKADQAYRNICPDTN